jgi:hypothetical protein
MYLFNYKSDPEENQLVDNETKKKELKKLADSFLKKTSIYGVRITNPENSESKDVSISIQTNVGKVVLTDEKGNSTSKGNFTANARGFLFSKSMEKNSTIEFNFIPYPDISFPKIGVEEDDVRVVGSVGLDDFFGGSEHVGHLVRIVLVHLTPEGADEQFFGHLLPDFVSVGATPRLRPASASRRDKSRRKRR